MDISGSAKAWKTRFTPLPDWDEMFAQGEWDYLDSVGEAPRYALIAGYVHRQAGRIAVLDVGCGKGILLRYLDQSRVAYSGTDISSTAIAQAQERFPQSDFESCDVADYRPGARQSFDAIVFNEVLPHIEDPLGTLVRYLDYLRPGGIAVISTYQNTNERSNAAMFSALLDEALKEGHFKLLAGCEVTTSEKGLRWRIDVLTAERSVNADD